MTILRFVRRVGFVTTAYYVHPSCPWVGLTHGLGWIGLGWVGSGSRIFIFSGLGWVMDLKWQICEKHVMYITCM